MHRASAISLLVLAAETRANTRFSAAGKLNCEVFQGYYVIFRFHHASGNAFTLTLKHLFFSSHLCAFSWFAAVEASFTISFSDRN